VQILIVKLSSMGDLVHALPMVSDIARAYPQARIDWVVEESFADVPALHPSVDRVLTVALRRWRRRPFAHQTRQALMQSLHQLREQRYDLIVDCQGLTKSALVAAAARGIRVGPDWHSAREPVASLLYQRHVPVSRQLHAIERNRRIAADALGYALTDGERFGIAEGVARHRPELPTPACVLLLTHASRATKYWPNDHWLTLESELANLGYLSFLACGSDKERQHSETLVRQMRQARVLPPMPIRTLAGYAAGMCAVIGLDTGLTHLAAAAGAPTIGIFCDYDPRLVGLRGDGMVRSLGGVDQCPSVVDVLRHFHEIALNRNPV
jgi:heptosyltransferase-1